LFGLVGRCCGRFGRIRIDNNHPAALLTTAISPLKIWMIQNCVFISPLALHFFVEGYREAYPRFPKLNTEIGRRPILLPPLCIVADEILSSRRDIAVARR